MTAPWHWTRSLDAALHQQIGHLATPHLPPVPWQQIASRLEERFPEHAFSIACIHQRWQSSSQAHSDIGNDASLLPILAPTLTTHAFLFASQQARTTLTQRLACKQADGCQLSDRHLQEGFLRFFFLHLLDLLQETPPFAQLPLHLGADVPLPPTAGRAFDLRITIDAAATTVRLFLPQAMLQALQTHFAAHPLPLRQLSRQRAIPLVLQICRGTLEIEGATLSTLQRGDFLVLGPARQEIAVDLLLAERCLWHGQLQPGKIVILHYASQCKERTMDTPVATNSSEHLVAADRVPLTLQVEVAQIEMQLHDLLDLQPGQTLELPATTGSSVVLRLHGQAVARGEIVQLGDVLAIQIAQLPSG